MTLSKSGLSTEVRHSVWNQLIWLFKPSKDKTQLISLLSSKANFCCDIHFLESSIDTFTEQHLYELFGILDNYYAFHRKQDVSTVYRVVDKILNKITSNVENLRVQYQSLCISVYCSLHKITHHILTQSKHENSLQEYLTNMNCHLTNLIALMKECQNNEQQSSLCLKLLSSILNHFSFFQVKYWCVCKSPGTVQAALDTYGAVFNFAHLVRVHCQSTATKHEIMLMNQAWFACITLVTENLGITSLHETFVQALHTANWFISNLFLALFNSEQPDCYDLKCFVLNLGKLTYEVMKLDARNINKKINSVLIQPIKDIFVSIPEKFATPLADVSIQNLDSKY